MDSRAAHEILHQLVGPDEAKRIMDDPDVEAFLQPLIYLGYLDRRVIDTSQAVDWDMVHGALRQIAAEAEAEGFEFRLTLTDGHWTPTTAASAWMQDLVSIEGEVSVTELPLVGNLSLWTRVLHFRLWVMGLLSPDAARQPWSAESMNAVEAFRKMLGLQTLLAMEALGNLEKVIEAVLGTPKFFAEHPRLAIFRFVSENDELWQSNGKKRFLKVLGEHFGGTDAQLEELQEKIRNPSTSWLSSTFATQRNQFLLRIVRVYQWVNGYYHGDLGPEFSKKSMESLLDLLDMDNRRDFRGLAVEVMDGYWALNIHKLMRQIDGADETFKAQESKPTTLDDIGEVLEQTPKSGVFSAAAKPDFLRVMGEEQQNRRNDLQRGYNSYCGSKSILKTAGKFLDKIKDWLSQLWEKLTGVAKNLASLVFRSARRAYRLLADGLSLLLGKRVFQTKELVWSDFAFDFDLVNFVDPKATEAEVETQSQLLRARTASLYTTLGLVGKAVYFIMNLSQPIGWLRLGLKLADMLRDLIRNPHPELD